MELPNQKKSNMKVIKKALVMLAIAFVNVECSQKQEAFQPKEVYQSKDLIVVQISENSFKHISFLQTNDFGNVPCNGLIVRNSNEAIVFDTPTSNETSEELIKWIKETLHCKINAIVPTHFHNDCLAGLKAFHENDVPSYAYFKTIELAKENDFVLPINRFTEPLTLSVGDENVMVKYFGEGHTKDNVVGYSPSENVLFGGCLIKELDASKGFLGDANVAEWSNTVGRIKKEYPNLKMVVPGHGEHGDGKLLDYTIKLFKAH
ncbi:MAG: subclass B1 metallo-beta-lactamase [Flammeovirgaceae bacterium]|jgi:metallo-beta-lactamase class B|nr:subclass B1 metallo-beta-lactamase [Flammeovirgaceae bacterium]